MRRYVRRPRLNACGSCCNRRSSSQQLPTVAFTKLLWQVPNFGTPVKRKRASADAEWQSVDDWVARPMGLLRTGAAPDLSWTPTAPEEAFESETVQIPAPAEAVHSEREIEVAHQSSIQIDTVASEPEEVAPIATAGTQQKQDSWLSGMAPGKLFLL